MVELVQQAHLGTDDNPKLAAAAESPSPPSCLNWLNRLNWQRRMRDYCQERTRGERASRARARAGSGAPAHAVHAAAWVKRDGLAAGVLHDLHAVRHRPLRGRANGQALREVEPLIPITWPQPP